MKRFRLSRPVLAAAVAIALSTGPLMAESSSWFWRSEEPKPKKPDVAPKSQTTIHKQQTTPADAAAGAKGAIPTTVPLTGDDAAYTAFDQGQYLTALKLAEEAAKRGEPQAYTLIGRIYGEGLGVGKDERKAFQSYSQAAELGDIPAAFALGIYYAEGRGIAKDRAAAARMFEKAALTGHAEANYNLGLLFLKGDGKPENPTRAFQHIRYAAEKGIAQAQYDLSALYQSGTGVEANALDAARWLSRAAGQGLAVAQYDYAVMLLKGMGLTADVPKAVGLMKAAAEKGIAGAQNRMAYIYLDGTGVDKNPVEAAKWRFIARKNGFDDKKLDDIVAKLGKSERQKAEVAASEWTDKIHLGPIE